MVSMQVSNKDGANSAQNLLASFVTIVTVQLTVCSLATIDKNTEVLSKILTIQNNHLSFANIFKHVELRSKD